MDIQLPKGKDKCEGVAVAAPMVKDNDGRSAPKIFHDMVNNSTGPRDVKSTTKAYPTTRANRSVLGATRGGVSYGSAAGRGPPPGLRGSPGDDYNAASKFCHPAS